MHPVTLHEVPECAILDATRDSAISENDVGLIQGRPADRTFGTITWRATAGLVLLCLGACGAPGEAPVAEQAPPEDARIESAVKLALIESTDVDAAAVSVVAADGIVTLDGFVATEEERAAALRIARDAAGTVLDRIDVRDR